MSECTIVPTSHPMQYFLAPENVALADVTVIEVFKVMFGYEVAISDAPHFPFSPSTTDDRTAIVGFSGSMRGACQVRMSLCGARAIASAMLGGLISDGDDDSINDALGELCNMLAGGWKNGVDGLSSECSLSPPTVVSGRNYQVHTSKPSLKLSRTYRFGIHTFHLTLCREEGVPLRDADGSPLR